MQLEIIVAGTKIVGTSQARTGVAMLIKRIWKVDKNFDC